MNPNVSSIGFGADLTRMRNPDAALDLRLTLLDYLLERRALLNDGHRAELAAGRAELHAALAASGPVRDPGTRLCRRARRPDRAVAARLNPRERSLAVKLTITSTDRLTHLDGVPVRVWEGTTAGGVPCLVLVHRLAVRDDRDTAEFDRELREMPPPGDDAARHNFL